MPVHQFPLRLLLAAGVSALALDAAPVAAQNALFRGRTGNPAEAAARAAQANANEQARARVQAQQSMAVFENAQAAMRAMQAAQDVARRAALASVSSVPNGLGVGGLELRPDGIGRVDGTPDTLAPVQTGPANAPTVTITQLRSSAILSWRSFNIGRETTLNFDQATFAGTRAREWSVLNRVEDVNPSLILGKINAPGQVFVINRNGIIFGGASQINVGTLVASTLDVGRWADTITVRDQRFREGLAQSLLTPEPGSNADPALFPFRPNLTVTDVVTLGPAVAAARTAGDRDRFAVNVQPGAQINIAEQGFALLAGAAGVRNAGTILAPSGQVHLAAAAGLRFQPVAQLQARTNPNFGVFGIVTYQAPDIGYYLETFRRPQNFTGSQNVVAGSAVGANEFLDSIRPEARNDGFIGASRGSITLAGSAVINRGVLATTTAANRAGSVFLLARDLGGIGDTTQANAANFATASNWRFGEVRLGAGSVTDVGTETGADQVVFNTATAPFQQSRIGINGSLVWFEGRSQDTQSGTAGPGAILRAPAGRLRIAADLSAGALFDYDANSNFQETSSLQLVQLGAGAVIDLGGLKGVEIPVSRNLIDLQVRNNILADQPSQRNGLLVDLANDRTSVVFDSRLGTALFETSGAVNAIPRSVAERQASGGSIDIAAERFVTQPDSRIDVSGGWISWQGGFRPPETQLIGSDGRIYRLSNAPADLTYVGRPGLFTRTQPRWGITENYVSPLFSPRQVFEPGYIEGFDAGSITIVGRSILAGVFEGSAFVGQRQARNANATTPNDGDRQTSTDYPNGGALAFLAQGRRIDSSISLARARVGTNFGASINPTFVTNIGDGLTEAFPEFDYAQPGALTTRTVVPGVANTPQGGNTRVAGTLPEALFDTRIPTATITDNGFRSVSIEAEGQLSVPAGVTVALRPGGSFTANVWNARIDGAIRVPSGGITITANSGERVRPTTADLQLLPAFTARPQPTGLTPLGTPATLVDGVPTEGSIIVGGTAVLSTRGLWVNDYLADQRGEPRQGGAFLNGGTIALATRYSGYLDIPRGETQSPRPPADAILPTQTEVPSPAAPIAVFGRDILLAREASVDVSGGGRASGTAPRPALTAGAAGSLALLTYSGLAASPTGVVQTTATPNAGAGYYPGQRNFAREDRYSAVIDRGASLGGFGLARNAAGAGNGRGGSISIQSPILVLGRTLTAAELAAGVATADLARFAAAGFASINLTATTIGNPYVGLPTGALSVASGSTIAPLPSSLLLTESYAGAPSGADPATFGAPALLAAEDRSPVRLSLTAEGRLDLGRKASADALPTTLIADAGAIGAGTPSVALTTGRPLYVDGRITAPGGTISIARSIDEPGVNNVGQLEAFAELRAREGDALWIAAGARLSVAGTATTVTDRFGITRGAVRPGGTISLSNSSLAYGQYIVIEGARGAVPAAVLDVSGASTTVSELRTGGSLAQRVTARALSSNAGEITVAGSIGVFLDGTLRALPGGPGASGGTLSLAAPSPGIREVRFFRPAGTPVPPLAGPVDPDTAFAGSILIGDAARTGLPVTALAAIDDPSAPIDPTLQPTGTGTSVGRYTGFAFLNPERLAGSGITRVNLLNGPVVVQGSPRLDAGRTLQLPQQLVLLPSRTTGAPPPDAVLAANSVIWVGGGNPLPSGVETPLAGRLTIAASGQLDITGSVDIRGAAAAILETGGDLRLSAAPPATLGNPGVTSVRRFDVALTSQGNLTLRAGQTYPATGVNATIQVVRQPGDAAADDTKPETIPTVTFEGIGGAPPRAPLSAGSILTVNARQITQAGVLRVPQGELRLNASDRITFAPGSLTSIAADGRTVPLGQSRSDQNPLGIEIYDALYNLGSGTALQAPLTAPPTRAITLNAERIDLQAGANVDLSGGGELVAYRFVQGPGGSRDVLARAAVSDAGTAYSGSFQFSDRRDVFAILPGPQPYAAPNSPYIRDSGDSLGRGDVTTVGLGTATNDRAAAVGDQIEIGPGIPGLAAGRYTLLPARYAILGGYQVVIPPATGGLTTVQALDTAVQGRDGRFVVGATRTAAGTTLAEAPRLVTIRPPEVWGALSQLVLDNFSTFFTQRAALTETPPPRLPVDAGRLTVQASRQLVLDATTVFGRGPGGRGGQVEISADLLAVAPRNRIVATADGGSTVIGPDGAPRADLAGFLPVAGEALTALGAESLVLGGLRNNLTVRSSGTAPEAIPEAEGYFVVARSVRLTEGAAVTAPDILVLAGQAPSNPATSPAPGIVLEAGAALVAAGAPVVTGFESLAIGEGIVLGGADGGVRPPGDPADLPGFAGSALLRVTTGSPLEILRTVPQDDTARLAGVTLGPNTLLAGPTGAIDLVGAATVADSVNFAVGNLQVSAPRLVLGTAPAAIPGAFTFSQGVLARIRDLGTLTLIATGGEPIDAFGNVGIAAGNRINLDAAGLRAGADARIALQAGIVEFRNTIDATPIAASGGGATLRITAPAETRIGDGAFGLAGIGDVAVDTGALVAAGEGRLDLAAPLTVTAGRITAETGASVDITTPGAVRLLGTPVPGASAIGGRIAITGGSVELGTLVQSGGGTVALTATAGDVVLQPGSGIDVRGVAVPFFDVVRYVAGGNVNLSASGTIALGGVIDVTAADVAAVEAEAGRVSLTAGGAAVFQPGGQLRGFAAPGGRSGSVRFDGAGAVDLPGLNTAFDLGGFFEERIVTAGAGDLVVEAGRVMAARNVSLTANAGRVLVGGTIDAGGAKGGDIALWSRDGVRLEAGALLTALNTTPGARGGNVVIGTTTTTGPLVLLGNIVAYAPGSSDPLYGGGVRLRVPVGTGGNVTEPTRIAARTGGVIQPFDVLPVENEPNESYGIIPPASVLREAFRLLDEATAGSFAPGLRVTPELVVRNLNGGLTLAEGAGIDLCAAGGGSACTFRTLAGEGGVLTLQAAGDITILADITDGFTPITRPPARVQGQDLTTIDTGLLLDGRSGWSLRFAAGARATGADPLATTGSTGSVLIGQPYTYDPSLPGNARTTPVIVRTGTGSIEIAAAADILLRDPDAVVYTAGRRLQPPTELRRVNASGQTVIDAYVYTLDRFDAALGEVVTEYFYLPIDPSYDVAGRPQPIPGGPPQPSTEQGTLAPTLARYPVEGGDLVMRAGQDIRAQVTDVTGVSNAGQVATAWWWRNGVTNTDGQFLYRPAVDTRYLFAGNQRFDNTPAVSSQTTWYPVTGQFQQNWGLLGGGDATITSGRDFQGSVSIPTSGITFGGLASEYSFSYRTAPGNSAPIATVAGTTLTRGGGTAPITVVYGGGDLDLRVGRDILPFSQILLGRGTGQITAGGAVIPGPTPTAGIGLVPGLLIGISDSVIRVTAAGGISATSYDPLQGQLAARQGRADAWGYGGFQSPSSFTTSTARTLIALVSTSGDVTVENSTNTERELRVAPREFSADSFTRGLEFDNFGTPAGAAGRGIPSVGIVRIEPEVALSPNFEAVAMVGDIGFAPAPLTGDRTVAPSVTLVAPATTLGSLRLLAGGEILNPRLFQANRSVDEIASVLAPLNFNDTFSVFAPPGRLSPDNFAYRAVTGSTPYVVASDVLRADNPNRDLVYALGDITRPEIGFAAESVGFADPYANRIAVRAGRDITDAAIYLLHGREGDVSVIQAGRDIGTALQPGAIGFGNVIEIGGPGRLQILAGRNIAPVRQPVIDSNPNVPGNQPGPVNGFRSVGNARNLALPEGGATLDILFGIGDGAGPDPDALLNRLLDPANAAAAFGTYRVELGSVLRRDGSTEFLPGVAQANGGVVALIQPNAPEGTDPATLTAIRALPAPERLGIAIDLYFRELAAAGREAAATDGPRAGSYVRGFDAIASLFPNRPEYAGTFNIQNTFIRTEQRGDLNVLGPGGDFLIGAVAGRPEPQGFADRFGVLTLGYGNINIFTDGDVAAGQSRILTLDGGDILAWSSTRDINAGLGARTARFVPPFRVSYLNNLVQVADRAGQITGSGIATFTPFTPPDQVASLTRTPASAVEAYTQAEERRRRALPLSGAELTLVGANSTGPQVILIAPVGTVDFGDAGVRVAGDLLVAARTVANASNATVAGTSVGVPTVAVPNVAGAIAASSTAGAANQAAETAANAARGQSQQPQQRPRSLTARVVGWGDSEEEAARPR